ncbi:MAG: serine/threonine-protein phosphatase [Actinobacteria bacterium]|nr:serine/threonine-protein phosphatase [Actinomycetota bacterium]MBW3647357.1 serine/threonine-protein phosphatase [Actinomycetota bacterium]
MSELDAPLGAPVGPPRQAGDAAFTPGLPLLTDILAALAGADTAGSVAAAGLPLLLEQPGVRACAVLVRNASDAVVLASAGYDCGTMAAGMTLPLDAGLPVTEAISTSRLVVRGTGPSWVAVPFGRRRTGALLLSLTSAPPGAAEDLARLHRLARALGDALERAGRQERAVVELADVALRLAPALPTGAGLDVAVRCLPIEGAVGGDVALCLPDPRGGHWLFVADVCGAGLLGALTARSVATAAVAVAPFVDGPEQLLAAVERAVRPDVGAGSFVTAVAAHLTGGRLRVASAGHPPPLLLTATAVVTLSLDPGEPLALEIGAGVARRTTTYDLPVDAVLLLHTDGLTDRCTDAGTRVVEALELVSAGCDGSLDAIADCVLAAAQTAGEAGDDVSLLLVRVPATGGQ